ncbi:NAD dependent epimerase/dehydratase family [Carpediemonas membranifera]|uniref:NAD dependent epimerase/dehydratase family n=1 Tax=Carpediemonas membranifera TaxID=201153 RepID=A0A8J6EAT1_9EUKA|nr:NAD dependent epimerase/dehydratase family [Carpediemonas membranifera]|eukprot:KAG9395290.1 NAD dependent epimerase/dehydratase family [Carpediemonas membranifera]
MSSSYLILGGCGFIGRHLIKYLLDEKLASKIKVADRTLPMMCNMHDSYEALYDNEIVTFKQADLSRADHIERAFEDGPFDFVINLAAETKLGLAETEYKDKVQGLTVNVAKAAAAAGSKFIEVSDARVLKPSKKPAPEDASKDPTTNLAKFKLAAEAELTQIPDLQYVILRPAVVYGPGDQNGVIASRLVCAAVYKHLGEKMKFLWDGKLGINTVHVTDVARAIVHACKELPSGAVYNIADSGCTTAGSINEILGNMFGIKTGFVSAVENTAAKMKLSMVTGIVNDKHLKPWAELCKKDGIFDTPLSPFLDKEVLGNNHLNVDGTAITATGFKYRVTQMTEGKLRQMVNEYVEQGFFPKSVL